MSWWWSFKFYTLQETCVIKTGPCYPFFPGTPATTAPRCSAHTPRAFHLCWWAGLITSFAWNALLQVSMIYTLAPFCQGALSVDCLSEFIFLHGTYHYLKYFRYWFGFSPPPPALSLPLPPTALSLPLSILFTDIPTGSKTSIWQTRYLITL